jgi:hypothetical protein
MTSPNPDQRDEITAVTEAMTHLEATLTRGPDPILREDVKVDVPDPTFKEPWDRRPEETDLQWALFEHFRDSGSSRSPTKTYTWIRERGGYKGQKAGLKTVFKMSSVNRWAERAQKWDAYQERMYQIARNEAVRDMVLRHEGQIEEALEGIMAPIRALNHRIESDPDFIASLSKSSAAKLISMSNSAARTIPNLMSAERLARGMPTEVVGGTVDVNHVVRIDRDHIGEVLDVLAGAGVLDGRGNRLGVGEVVDAEVVDDDPVPAEGDE